MSSPSPSDSPAPAPDPAQTASWTSTLTSLAYGTYSNYTFGRTTRGRPLRELERDRNGEREKEEKDAEEVAERVLRLVGPKSFEVRSRQGGVGVGIALGERVDCSMESVVYRPYELT